MLLAGTAMGQGTWSPRQATWTEADERGFEAFVAALGESDCRTVPECLNNASPIRLPRVRFFADCADFPYVLRAVYAGVNGLPFSYVAGITPARTDDPSRDIRYTWHGNRVTSRRTLTGSPAAALRDLVNTISTASYRVDHRDPAPQHLHDLYPVAITREAIRPGVVFYDPQGHVSTVYRVDDDGTVHFIDAHPDNSVTRRSFSPANPRAHPKLGGGFLAWRPQRRDGPRVALAPNAELADFSLVQYVGTRPDARDWERGTFAVHGRETTDFHAFVRASLTAPGYRLDPVAEVQRQVRGLCGDLQDRVVAVELARRDGIARRPAPARLPANIYGADGDWETYSTPARDARLRASFAALRTQFADLLARRDDPTLAYDGSDLAADLRAAYQREAASCAVAYTNSRGETVRLGFEDVVGRLFALSFDPYHCPERRWGAADSELASCPDDATKARWYAAQQPLRFATSRDVQARMGWTLDELERANPLPETIPPVDPASAFEPATAGFYFELSESLR